MVTGILGGQRVGDGCPFVGHSSQREENYAGTCSYGIRSYNKYQFRSRGGLRIGSELTGSVRVP